MERLQQLSERLNRLKGVTTIQLEGQPVHAPVEGFAQAPVPGHEGMYWSLLPPVGLPAGSYSHMVVCGQQGTHYPRTSLPHSVRICVLAGALLWNQHSQGPEPRRVEAGQSLDVSPGEEYGYLVLEDYTGYLTFTPAL